MDQVSENIARLKARTGFIAAECRRNADEIHLVAVSKQQPDDRVDAALSAGQRLFGENRVQEAMERWSVRRLLYPGLQLHLIGPLQTNKVREAVALFNVIETLDRIRLADALKAEMVRQEKFLPCFIQVNTGSEEQKAGVSPEDFPALLEHCRSIGLNVTGLMCIPPVNDPPALHFSLLKKIGRAAGLNHFSMGMSADFEKAIPLGATYIRLGTAIFGARV